MLNASRRGLVVRSIALVAGLLACTALALPSSLHAQAEGAANPNRLRVRLAATGTQDLLAVSAYVTVSEPAYVAVFEIHPGVGALMLYPSTRADRGLVTRSTTFDLADFVLNQYRQEFRRLALPRFQYTSQAQARGYLVAIASRLPLNTSVLEAGRILMYSSGMAQPYDIVDELVSLIVPAQPAGDWSYDVYGYFKDQEPALAYLMSPGYFTPESALFGYQESYCYGSSWLFGSLMYMYPGSYYGGCGALPYGTAVALGGYGRGYGWGYGWGWGWGSGPWYTPREQPRTAGPVDTHGMTPGTPRYRDRHPVEDAPGAPAVAGKVAEGREKAVRVTDPTDASERFREILDQLGDAGSTAVIGPQTLIRNQAAFARLGLRTTPHLAYRMEAQAIEAQRRLANRLQSMGVSAREAAAVAGSRGAAPQIDYFGGHATVVRPGALRTSYGSTSSVATGRPSSVSGASRVQSQPVSRPAPPRARPVTRPRARPVSRPAPIRPVRVVPPAPRPHSSHGGGGHGQR